MGKSFREQMIALDLGKADVIEVAPDQARRAAAEGRRIENSAPEEWMGLVFSRDPRSDEIGLREEITAGPGAEHRPELDEHVLLQGGGEPAGTFLPDWMTGYAFLLPTGADMTSAADARRGSAGPRVGAGLPLESTHRIRWGG